jgi:hypothetical protein
MRSKPAFSREDRINRDLLEGLIGEATTRWPFPRGRVGRCRLRSRPQGVVLCEPINCQLDYDTLSQVALNVTEETTRQALPTVTGFAAKQAIAALQTHKINTAPLLHRAGLSEQGLEAARRSPQQHRVSAIAQARFLDYAAEALDDSAFGLHLAQQANPRDAGILFYVVSGATNVGR